MALDALNQLLSHWQVQVQRRARAPPHPPAGQVEAAEQDSQHRSEHVYEPDLAAEVQSVMLVLVARLQREAVGCWCIESDRAH